MAMFIFSIKCQNTNVWVCGHYDVDLIKSFCFQLRAGTILTIKSLNKHSRFMVLSQYMSNDVSSLDTNQWPTLDAQFVFSQLNHTCSRHVVKNLLFFVALCPAFSNKIPLCNSSSHFTASNVAVRSFISLRFFLPCNRFIYFYFAVFMTVLVGLSIALPIAMVSMGKRSIFKLWLA